MSDEMLASSDDGTLEYRRLSSKYLDESLVILRNSFVKHENFCKATRLAEYPEAVDEFIMTLAIPAINEGLSILAIDKATDRVAGIAINKLNLKSDHLDESFIEEFHHPSMRDVAKFIVVMENSCNLFELCKTDCIFEIFILSTLPEFRGKGIAKKLSEISIGLAKELKDGVNVKKSLDDGNPIDLDSRPQAVSSIFTSFITQKIGRQMNFEVAAISDCETFIRHDGKTFASAIEDQTKVITLEYLKI